MPLLLEFQSGGTAAFRADELVLRRELGKPLTWRCMVNIENDMQSPVALAEILESGDAQGRPVWRQPGTGASFSLWSDMRVVTAEPQQVTGAVHKVLLICSDTAEQPDGGVSPRAPRWRIHVAPDMLALARRLANVVTVPQCVAVPLERITFPDGPDARTVQDGLSDWEFANWVFGQYPRRSQAHAGASIVLSGGASERDGTAGKWYAAFADYESYVKLNAVSSRTIPPPSTRLTQVRFAGYESSGAAPDAPGAHLAYLSVSRLYTRPSANAPPDDWANWRAGDLPLFLQDTSAMIWAIDDRFVVDGELLLWETILHTVPVGGRGPAATASAPRPWLRVGQVVETSKRGPWVKVRLPAEFASDQNVVLARLSTPYSGVDGQTGMHLTPAKDTSVLVGWSGRLGESVVLLGNIRGAESKADAPALHLDLGAHATLANIKIDSVGKIAVTSALDVAVEKAVDVRTKAALTLEGDGGAAAKLSGGVFNVGSGG